MYIHHTPTDDNSLTCSDSAVTVCTKGGAEVLTTSTQTKEVIDNDGLNADPNSVDYRSIFMDLLHDETNQNSLSDHVNFRKTF